MDLVKWFVYHTGGKVYIRLIGENKQEVVLTNMYPKMAEGFALDVIELARVARREGREAPEPPPAHSDAPKAPDPVP